MKDYILNNLKKVKQKPTLIHQIVLGLMFLVGISLSIKHNGLFITELVLLGFIVLFAFVGSQTNSKNNNN